VTLRQITKQGGTRFVSFNSVPAVSTEEKRAQHMSATPTDILTPIHWWLHHCSTRFTDIHNKVCIKLHMYTSHHKISVVDCYWSTGSNSLQFAQRSH